jgi:hypothetical protein
MQITNTVALAKFVACCQYQRTICPPWSTFRLMDSLVPNGRKIIISKQCLQCFLVIEILFSSYERWVIAEQWCSMHLQGCKRWSNFSCEGWLEPFLYHNLHWTFFVTPLEQVNLSKKVFTCSNLKLLEYPSIWIKDIYTIHQNSQNSSLDFLINFCQIWQQGRVVKLWSSFWHVVVGFWNDLIKIGRTSFLSSFLCSFLCTYIFPFFISFFHFVRLL